MFKIVFGGIHIESCTFSKYKSSKSDFIIKRDDLLDMYYWLGDYSTINIPLIYARALPGGIVDRNFFDEWLCEFISKLEDVPNLDGIFLDIHGAMCVEDLKDAEGYIVSKIRSIVGSDVIISITMDLHGNISEQLFTESDIITALRTAPHVDIDETKERAFTNLLSILSSDRDLIKRKVDLPFLLPGEKTFTEVFPGSMLYETLEIMSNTILDCSLLMGFPWADEARSHAVTVFYGFDEHLVDTNIKSFSDLVLKHVKDFKFVGDTQDVYGSIDDALNHTGDLFILSDTGDNTGAGGSGDNISILDKFIGIKSVRGLEKNVLFASICDSKVIETLYTMSIGKVAYIKLGGSIESTKNLDLFIHIDSYFTDNIGGRCAIVSMGTIQIIITEFRTQFSTYADFDNAGFKDLSEVDILVVKMGYLVPYLSKICDGSTMALSDGVVSQDLTNFTYTNLTRPIYPLDNI